MQVALFFCLAVVGHAVASPVRFNSLGRGSPFAPQDVGARADALTSNSDRVENTDQTVRAVETQQPTARFGSLFGRGDPTPPFGALLRDEASVQQGEVRLPQSNARTDPSLVDQYEQPLPRPLLPPPAATERVTYNPRNGAENEGSLLSTTAGGLLQDRQLPRFVQVLLLTKKDDDDDDSRDDKESRERDGKNIGKQIAASTLTDDPLETVKDQQSIGNLFGTKYTSSKESSDISQSPNVKKHDSFQKTTDTVQNNFYLNEELANNVQTSDLELGKTALTKELFYIKQQPNVLNAEKRAFSPYHDPRSLSYREAGVIEEVALIKENVEKTIEGSLSSVNEQTFVQPVFLSANENFGGVPDMSNYPSFVDGVVGQPDLATASGAGELLEGQSYVAVAVEPTADQGYVAAAVEPTADLGYVAAAVEPTADQGYVAAAVEPTADQGYVAAAVEPTADHGYVAAAVEPTADLGYVATAVEPTAYQGYVATAVEPTAYQGYELPVVQPQFETIGGEAQSPFGFAEVTVQRPVDETEKGVAEGFRPSRYTNLDLAAVNFDNINQRSSGHKEYITVKDNDFSGETDIYKLVGVAPSEAVRGGSASTYSAKIGPTVPIYAELDDANSYWIRNLAAAVRRATPYSAGGSVGTPLKVRTETAVSGDTFAVLLDD